MLFKVILTLLYEEVEAARINDRSLVLPSSDTNALPLRAKSKRELNAKLKGATLGDAECEVDDTLKWMKRSKKEKELAKKRQ